MAKNCSLHTTLKRAARHSIIENIEAARYFSARPHLMTPGATASIFNPGVFVPLALRLRAEREAAELAATLREF